METQFSSSSSSHFTPTFLHRLRRRPPPPSPSRFLRVLSAKSSEPSFPSLPPFLQSIPNWADTIKERGVRNRRSLYTHDSWLNHRSSLRHIRHVLSSLSSRVILSLVPPVFAFTSFAATLAVYNSAVVLRWLPEFFPLLHASSLPYQLTAPALALLLVFRTEASYARFVEGRKAWLSVVAGASEMAGIVISSMSKGKGCLEEARAKKALLNYIMAFPVALKDHVTAFSDIKVDLQNLLEEDDLAVILHAKHRPRCVIEFITQSLHMLPMEESKRNTLVGVLIEEPFPMLALDDLCKQLNDSIFEAIEMEKSVHARLAAKLKGQHDGHTINGWPNS